MVAIFSQLQKIAISKVYAVECTNRSNLTFRLLLSFINSLIIMMLVSKSPTMMPTDCSALLSLASLLSCLLFLRQFFSDLFCTDLFADCIDELSKWLGSLITCITASYRYRSICFFLLSNYQHVWQFIQSCLTDLESDLL